MAAGYQCQTDTRDIRREGGVKQFIRWREGGILNQLDEKESVFGGGCIGGSAFTCRFTHFIFLFI